MKYTTVKNPKWANKNHSIIECEVNFDDLSEDFVPFSAVASGDLKHTHEIFSRCVAGEFGQIAEYQAPSDITGTEALVIVRGQRDYMLETVVDPVISNPLRWADMTPTQQQAWSDYRRALLDITTTYPNPSFCWNEQMQHYDAVGFTWPVKPA